MDADVWSEWMYGWMQMCGVNGCMDGCRCVEVNGCMDGCSCVE